MESSPGLLEQIRTKTTYTNGLVIYEGFGFHSPEIEKLLKDLFFTLPKNPQIIWLNMQDNYRIQVLKSLFRDNHEALSRSRTLADTFEEAGRIGLVGSQQDETASLQERQNVLVELLIENADNDSDIDAFLLSFGVEIDPEDGEQEEADEEKPKAESPANSKPDLAKAGKQDPAPAAKPVPEPVPPVLSPKSKLGMKAAKYAESKGLTPEQQDMLVGTGEDDHVLKSDIDAFVAHKEAIKNTP